MNGHLKLYHGLGILALATGVCLLIAMSSGPVPSSANPLLQAQSDIRRSSPTPPPEVAEMEKIQKQQEQIPKPQARATKQQLEDLIMKQEGGADKIRMAKVRTVPSQIRRAPASPPPEVVERERLEKEQQNIPKAQSRPSRQQLEEIIMKQPGGADMLKRAKGGKPPTAQNWQRLRDWMAWLNPFAIRTAYAFQTQALSLDYKVSRPATMNGNDPNLFDLLSRSPSGSVRFWGSEINAWAPNATSFYVAPPGANTIQLDGQRYTSFCMLDQTMPAAGYYVINLNAYLPAGANIKLAAYGSTGYTTLRTFGPATAAGVQNLPYLDYFTAGKHYFYWVSTNLTIFIHQVNVDAY